MLLLPQWQEIVIFMYFVKIPYTLRQLIGKIMRMKNTFETAHSTLLSPTGLTSQDLESVLGAVLGHRIDHADLYFQDTHHENWILEDGIIKEGSYDIDRGVGVRAMAGERTGFAYSNDLVLPALQQAASAAKSIAKKGTSQSLSINQRISPHNLYNTDDPITSMHESAKVLPFDSFLTPIWGSKWLFGRAGRDPASHPRGL